MDAEYGRRLLPNILHDKARQDPFRKYAIVTNSSSEADGSDFVTFAQVSRAVNFVANWLQDIFEGARAPEPETTLAFIGVADVRYSILFYAGVQCRYKVFLPSPRNPAATNVSLLDQLQCNRLVYTGEVSTVAQGLVQSRSEVRSYELPSVQEMLKAPATTYLYDLKFEDVHQEAVLVLHSSGSTGPPKPVVCTHGTCATYDVRDYPEIPDRKTVIPITLMDFPRQCVYNMFPPFHLAGVMYNMLLPLFGESINVFSPPLRPPSGALAAEMIRIHKPRGVYVPPIIIEQLSKEADFVELVSSVDLMIFAGGPLPDTVGDQVAVLTQLGQFYGATEIGMIHQLLPTPENWSWMEFHPHEPFELQPLDDGLSYEMVLFANVAVKSTSSFQHNYPDLHEWRTKDLFVQHPTKPNLWKFHARRDDILVLSNGHKVNPLPVETALKTNPSISGALIVGQGRPTVALLIELNSIVANPVSPQQEQELWLAVEKANFLLPAYGQILRSMIIIAGSEKPFKRAAKGTVVRRLTEQLYDQEIETLYGTDVVETMNILSVNYKLEDVKTLIRSAFRRVSIDEEHLQQEEDNFFMFGIDSVKTLEVLKYLRSGLSELKDKSELRWLTVGTFSRYSTISALALILFEFLKDGKTPSQRDRVLEMQAKIAEYVKALPQYIVEKVSFLSHQDGVAIAITGTTGFLGGYLVKELAQSELISHIYCLNRSSRAEELFRERHPAAVTGKKLIFLTTDFTSPHLGLTARDHEHMLQDCEIILHNAWRVNFNLHLSGFEDNLLGLKNLINFSAASRLRPRLVFISSVSATGWRDPMIGDKEFFQTTRIPESIVHDISTSMDMGYAESKCVAEHVLYAAASFNGTVNNQPGSQEVSIIPSTILRLCQVSPEKDSKWPENDAIAALMRSCKTLRAVPVNYTDVVDWIPVNQVASIISDVIRDELIRRKSQAEAKEGSGNDNCRFYNIVNPHVQSWFVCAEALRERCNADQKGGTTQFIRFSEWIQTLQKVSRSAVDVDDKYGNLDVEGLPAARILRLLDLASAKGETHTYEIVRLMKISPTMRDVVKMIDLDTFRSWLQAL